jgi:putative nucleotidyltransferase with HDIG domain
MNRAAHLVRRFFASLRPRPLGADDLAFVQDALVPQELECWARLGPADRAESVATGRALVAELESADRPADPQWVAAALLHDVGKAETTLGVVGRSVATAAAVVAGPRRARAFPGAFGRYVNHDELGAEQLRAAGARSEAVSWAAAHHRPARWAATGIPPTICRMLAAADGEPSPG